MYEFKKIIVCVNKYDNFHNETKYVMIPNDT